MELVRAYVTLGFKTIQSIHPKDINRIVSRYLAGDDMQTIANEEAKRIRNEHRKQAIKESIQEEPEEVEEPKSDLSFEPFPALKIQAETDDILDQFEKSNRRMHRLFMTGAAMLSIMILLSILYRVFY